MANDIFYIVECPQGFNDFSIIKSHVPPGGRVEVNPSQLNQMKMSDPTIVVVDKRIPIDSETAKILAKKQAEKDKVKEEIKKRHEKDAPPRRKKGSGGRSLGALDTSRPVSSAELVHLPVTKRGKDDD
jgi:hypothetical protein